VARMSPAPRTRRHPGRRIALLTAAVLVGYFAYHLALGDRGVARLLDLRAERATALAAHDAALAAQATWEARVAPLRDATLDPDAVEARAREVLGYRREGERSFVVPSACLEGPGPDHKGPASAPCP
jgi:cell division protein FtsB